MSKKNLFLLIFSTCFDLIFAQKFTDSTYVKLTNQKIVINGIDDESDWDKAESRSNFWQWFPTDTIKAIKQTEIKFLYDSNPEIYNGYFSKGETNGCSNIYDTTEINLSISKIGVDPCEDFQILFETIYNSDGSNYTFAHKF